MGKKNSFIEAQAFWQASIISYVAEKLQSPPESVKERNVILILVIAIEYAQYGYEIIDTIIEHKRLSLHN
jgi:hypothetical protein